MNNQQKTISRIVEYSGIGLFNGEGVKLRFKPAPANTGIKFIRTDIESQPKNTPIDGPTDQRIHEKQLKIRRLTGRPTGESTKNI